MKDIATWSSSNALENGGCDFGTLKGSPGRDGVLLERELRDLDGVCVVSVLVGHRQKGRTGKYDN